MTAVQTPVTFGAWIRSRRRQLDLTQSELGKRAGCSEAAVRKIEADERKPSRQLAELLAAALEIPASERGTFLQFARGLLVKEIRIAPKTHPHNLPALLTSTVDRTRDLANVTSRLNDGTVHLVTLIGPPGIGKTRLSIHCGNELLDSFPDGVWFVDLADVTNADFFLATLARFLPALSLPPSPNLDQLLSRLRDQHLLLILDNFEQIVEGAAMTVAQMLKTCPSLKILVTSRVHLRLYGENEYPLPPLSIPPREAEKSEAALTKFESVQLFAARIRQHQPKFSITKGNAGAVIEICTVLDGIPLALELAAATLRQMTLEKMVAILREQGWGRQIGTAARDLPHRQRTLENVIDWSYQLLDDGQRVFFAKLGVFSGWFDEDAVSAVCEMPAQPFLNLLADHSLLVCEIAHGKTRWRMLELIREYAASKLDFGQRSRVEQRRAEHYLGALQTVTSDSSKRARADFFLANVGNLHAAVRWTISSGQAEHGFQLTGFLEEYWFAHGYFKEGLELMRELFALPFEGGPALRAERLQTASDLAWQQHDFETAVLYSREAAELGRKYGLKGKYSAYINRLGRIYIEQGRYEEAKQALQEGLELATQEPENMKPAVLLTQLGEIALFEGRLEEARSLLEQALSHQTDDEMIFLAMAKTDLAEISLAKGEYDQALDWLKQAYPHASQHTRRFLVFLCALAGHLVLLSTDKVDLRTAAQLYGVIEKLSARSGLGFNAFYQKLNRERIQLAREKLSEREWLEAFESGFGWDRGEAVQLAGTLLKRKHR